MKSQEEKDYKTLGLKPGASLDDIKHAFRELAKKYYPRATTPTGIATFTSIVESHKRLIEEKRLFENLQRDFNTSLSENTHPSSTDSEEFSLSPDFFTKPEEKESTNRNTTPNLSATRTNLKL